MTTNWRNFLASGIGRHFRGLAPGNSVCGRQSAVSAADCRSFGPKVSGHKFSFPGMLIQAGRSWRAAEAQEYQYLSFEQRKALIRRTIEFVDGHVPVVVGISHPSFKTAIELAHDAEKLGVRPYEYRRSGSPANRGRKDRTPSIPSAAPPTARQAHRPSELARRDVDQHLVHRPFAEPVFALRGLPTGKSLLLAVDVFQHPSGTPYKIRSSTLM